MTLTVTATTERVCTLLLEQLLIVFVYWTPEEAAPYFSDVAAIVDGGLNSGSELVRRAARDVVAALSSFWYVLASSKSAAPYSLESNTRSHSRPSRVGELRDIPPQQRIRLVYENPDSGIATALLERHADLADKVQKFQRRESKNPVRPRVNARRTSSIVKKEADGEPSNVPEVKAPAVSSSLSAADNSVLPDRLSEETLSEEAVEHSQTALTDKPLQPLVERPVEGNHVDALPVHDTELVMGQSELAEADFQDGSLIPHVPPEFNGSQMYAHAQAESDARAPSVVREDPPQRESRSLKTEPTLLDKGTGRRGAQRSSVRATSESRIPVRAPSRSSSIPVPASRNRSEAPALRSAIPPIEFTGLSVSSQNTESADNIETNLGEKPNVPPLETESLDNAGPVTSVPVSAGNWAIDLPTVAERDCSQVRMAPENSASLPTGSEQVANRPSGFALPDVVHGSSPLPAVETGRVAADDVEEAPQLVVDPVGAEAWFTPTTTAASSNPDDERPVGARGIFTSDTTNPGDSGLLKFDEQAVLQTPMAKEAMGPIVAEEAHLLASSTNVAAYARGQDVIMDDTVSQEVQQASADVDAAAVPAPVLDDSVQPSPSTVEAEPHPKGALERLQEVRQQYADLRSISKFDVRDFPVQLPPEVLIHDETPIRDDTNPIRLEDRDFVAVGGGLRTELAGPEGLDTKTRGRNRQPREQTNRSGVERDVGTQASARPRIPSRGADARRSRRTVVAAQRDHTHDRSRESSRERRVGNGERGGDATAAVSERPMVRKKSIPNLLKGVRLKYEDKPGAPLQIVGDAEVPHMLQNQLDYVSDAVPTTATESFADTPFALPEFAPPDRVETHPTSSLDEDAPAQMSYGTIAPPRPRAALEATHADDDDAPTWLHHAPIAPPEPPTAMKTTPTDTRTAPSRGPSSTRTDVEHAQPPRASPYRLVQEDEPSAHTLRHHVPTPTKPQSSWSMSTWNAATIVWFWVVVGLVFGGSGLLRAATTIRETYEYHHALKLRIDRFEVSVAESHETVHKLEENYAVWSEYVRVLAEEDEANAVAHLEMIQQEVEKWQRDMKADLLEFRRSLSAEGVDAVLAPLLQNATQGASRDGK